LSGKNIIGWGRGGESGTGHKEDEPKTEMTKKRDTGGLRRTLSQPTGDGQGEKKKSKKTTLEKKKKKG